MYTAHLIFWMVWGAALRGLTTGTRWPCSACMPLLYCLFENVIDTDCRKSLTTSEQHQSIQSLLIIPSWWAAAHVLPTDGGCRCLPLLMTTNSFLTEVAAHDYRSTTAKIKSCVFKAENLVGKMLINQSYLDNKLINVVTVSLGLVCSLNTKYIKNWGWDGVMNYPRNPFELCYQLRLQILTPRRVCCSNFASLASGCRLDTWNHFTQTEEPAIHFTVSQRC